VTLNFTAIDFETANGSPASPCAVGLSRVRDGQIVEQLSLLFRPPWPHDWFAAGNVKVHGITAESVTDAPGFEEALPELLLFLEDDLLIAHNAGFDMGVLKSASLAVNFDVPNYRYGCSLQMSRRTYNLESYRLNAVAYAAGHEEFQHHDALADSDACARIMIHMAKRHGVDTVEDLAQATRHKLKQILTEVS
jgi:DNA polymerase-3 subunit epsilon